MVSTSKRCSKLRTRRFQWAGHVQKMEENISARKCFSTNPIGYRKKEDLKRGVTSYQVMLEELLSPTSEQQQKTVKYGR
uniref:Uncharacterized protein n=1 Tax=Megaselia scalaris TaxID=36166 RepID=T1H409_MEGSC